MEEKSYTVKEVSALTGVTIKALHHYDAIGLLKPSSVSDAGYRLYGHPELQRLQEILFYRELAIPLKQITLLLQGTVDRTKILKEQYALLSERQQHTSELLQTLTDSIQYAEEGKTMDATTMFKGFATKEQWQNALQEQNTHLEATYKTNLATDTINVDEMNEAALEATRFIKFMALSVKNKLAHDDPNVQIMIKEHIAFLNAHGHATSPQDYTVQTKFLMSDAFHRQMMEAQQIGLSYYLAAAAEAFANKEEV